MNEQAVGFLFAGLLRFISNLVFRLGIVPERLLAFVNGNALFKPAIVKDCEGVSALIFCMYLVLLYSN